MQLAVSAVLGVLVLSACGGSARPASPPAPAAPAQPADDNLVEVLAGLDRSLAERPGDQVLLLLRAAYSDAAGRPDEAIAFLEKLDATGWDVPFTPVDFKTIAKDRRFQDIAARVAARAPRVKRSELAFTIPGPDLIPEGIAVDPATGTFYVGSIRKRTIMAIGRERNVRTFVPAQRDGISAVLGMKVDAKRGVLWATSYAGEGMEGFTEADRGRSEITAFALSDASTRRRIAFPAGTDLHLLNDLAIAADGTLYVTDSVAGAVWRVPPDRDVFEPLVAKGSLAYPNGIVLAWTGRLFVAHGTGIAIVDTATGAFTRMTTAPRAPLGGIDGLLLEGHTLLAVQNGLGVPRLVAIDVDDAGTRATALTVLENDASVLEIPTTSALFEGVLYTIANSQLDAIGPGGLNKDKKLEDPRIVRTPLVTVSRR